MMTRLFFAATTVALVSSAGSALAIDDVTMLDPGGGGGAPPSLDGTHTPDEWAPATTVPSPDADGSRVPRRRTEAECLPDCETFEAEVAESRELQQTIHAHESRLVIHQEGTDDAQVTRHVHPGDEAARRESNESPSQPSAEEPQVDWSRLSTRPQPSGNPGDARVGGP